jgi:hypothetical protein
MSSAFIFSTKLLLKAKAIGFRYRNIFHLCKKMNRYWWLLFIFSCHLIFGQSLEEKLRQIPGVKIEAKKEHPSFKEMYVVYFKMPIDHKDTTKGFFNQRVFIFHKDFAKPVVCVTEGYLASYALYPGYKHELIDMVDGNQIIIEHRFFGKSKPDSIIPWQYLTVKQAAADHHEIIQKLKKLYPGKWITTGASKGGSTATYHRCFYPNDVDVTVAYVAPFTINREDPRVIPFLKQVGDSAVRNKILRFQRAVLQRRNELRKYMEVDAKKYPPLASLDSILDYLVLEYAFSFWQYCGNPARIPDENAEPKVLWKHLTSVIPLSSYAKTDEDGTKAFYIQAYHEVGYYGYDTANLGKYLYIKAPYISNIILCPKEALFPYDSTALHEVRTCIKTNLEKTIFIYGADDPWTACAADIGNNKKVLKIVEPKACHTVEINNMSEQNRQLIVQTLSSWLSMKVQAPPAGCP